MIERVSNLTKKSFNSYSGPAEKFKLKNVIFGYNGRGKSSLALGLKDTYLDRPTSSMIIFASLIKTMLRIISF